MGARNHGGDGILEWIQAVEGNLLLLIQEFFRVSFLDPVVVAYTRMGDAGLLWIALALGMLCFKKTRRAGLVGLLALALGALCTNVVLKQLVARPRPWLTVEGLEFLVAEQDPNSFPSGHTCAAFAAAGAWWRTLPGRRAGLFAMAAAVLMGLSRLYVGVHFLSDVLAGCLVGLFCGWLAFTLHSRWRRRREVEEQ